MNRITKHTAFVSLGLVYFLFATQNAMVDSWYYAACVKYHTELINSHHLFYNYLGYFWFQFLALFFPKIEAISALNALNAIAAVSALYLIFLCLNRLKVGSQMALWLSLFCGVSFGFMRYACDAETYILPIVFSLASTLFYLKERNFKNVLISGCFSAIAILFHQVHLWWVTAIIIGLLSVKPFQFKQVLWFFLPLLFVPIVYWICFQYSDLTIDFSQFIFGEYGKGNAGIDLSLKAILLTIINLFRSFFQVHGNQIILIKEYPIFYSISFLLVTFSFMLAINRQLFKKPLVHSASQPTNTFLIAIVLHIIFAFLSSGNAEFMVMLPFLLVLYLASKIVQPNHRLFKFLTISMFIWNTSFAIIPSACLNISKVDKQVEYSSKKAMVYTLWKNKPLVENHLTYQLGFKTSNHQLLSLKSTETKALDTLLNNGNTIFTDIPNTKNVINREQLINDAKLDSFLIHYTFEKCDSFTNIYGKNYIYYIQKRMY